MSSNSSQRLTLPDLVAFINEIKDLNGNDFQNAFRRVAVDFEHNCKSFHNIALIDTLVECINTYINLMSTYLTHMNSDMIAKKIAVSKYMNVLNFLNSINCLKNVLFKKISPIIHEILCDPDLTEFVGLEVVRFYNNLARHTDRPVREGIGYSFAFYVFKLVDVLTASNCYEYQALILENLFLVCNEQNIMNLANDMFPDAESLQYGLKSFDLEYFDYSSRAFLNIANKIYARVLSVIADSIHIDENPIYGPVDTGCRRVPLWVDFNIYSMSIYCEQKSVVFSQEREPGRGWELITVFYDDIDSYAHFKPENAGYSLVFKIFLKSKMDVIYFSTRKEGSCKVISLVFNNSKAFEEIINKVTSRMKENKSNIDMHSQEDIHTNIGLDQTAVPSRSQSYKSLNDMYQNSSPTSSLTILSPSQDYMHLISTQVAADSTVDDNDLNNLNQTQSSEIYQCLSFVGQLSNQRENGRIFQSNRFNLGPIVEEINVEEEEDSSIDREDESFESTAVLVNLNASHLYQSDSIIMIDDDDHSESDKNISELEENILLKLDKEEEVKNPVKPVQKQSEIVDDLQNNEKDLVSHIYQSETIILIDDDDEDNDRKSNKNGSELQESVQLDLDKEENNTEKYSENQKFSTSYEKISQNDPKEDNEVKKNTEKIIVKESTMEKLKTTESYFEEISQNDRQDPEVMKHIKEKVLIIESGKKKSKRSQSVLEENYQNDLKEDNEVKKITEKIVVKKSEMKKSKTLALEETSQDDRKDPEAMKNTQEKVLIKERGKKTFKTTPSASEETYQDDHKGPEVMKNTQEKVLIKETDKKKSKTTLSSFEETCLDLPSETESKKSQENVVILKDEEIKVTDEKRVLRIRKPIKSEKEKVIAVESDQEQGFADSEKILEKQKVQTREETNKAKKLKQNLTEQKKSKTTESARERSSQNDRKHSEVIEQETVTVTAKDSETETKNTHDTRENKMISKDRKLISVESEQEQSKEQNNNETVSEKQEIHSCQKIDKTKLKKIQPASQESSQNDRKEIGVLKNEVINVSENNLAFKTKKLIELEKDKVVPVESAQEQSKDVDSQNNGTYSEKQEIQSEQKTNKRRSKRIRSASKRKSQNNRKELMENTKETQDNIVILKNKVTKTTKSGMVLRSRKQIKLKKQKVAQIDDKKEPKRIESSQRKRSRNRKDIKDTDDEDAELIEISQMRREIDDKKESKITESSQKKKSRNRKDIKDSDDEDAELIEISQMCQEIDDKKESKITEYSQKKKSRNRKDIKDSDDEDAELIEISQMRQEIDDKKESKITEYSQKKKSRKRKDLKYTDDEDADLIKISQMRQEIDDKKESKITEYSQKKKSRKRKDLKDTDDEIEIDVVNSSSPISQMWQEADDIKASKITESAQKKRSRKRKDLKDTDDEMEIDRNESSIEISQTRQEADDKKESQITESSQKKRSRKRKVLKDTDDKIEIDVVNSSSPISQMWQEADDKKESKITESSQKKRSRNRKDLKDTDDEMEIDPNESSIEISQTRQEADDKKESKITESSKKKRSRNRKDLKDTDDEMEIDRNESSIEISQTRQEADDKKESQITESSQKKRSRKRKVLKDTDDKIEIDVVNSSSPISQMWQEADDKKESKITESSQKKRSRNRKDLKDTDDEMEIDPNESSIEISQTRQEADDKKESKITESSQKKRSRNRKDLKDTDDEMEIDPNESSIEISQTRQEADDKQEAKITESSQKKRSRNRKDIKDIDDEDADLIEISQMRQEIDDKKESKITESSQKKKSRNRKDLKDTDDEIEIDVVNFSGPISQMCQEADDKKESKMTESSQKKRSRNRKELKDVDLEAKSTKIKAEEKIEPKRNQDQHKRSPRNDHPFYSSDEIEQEQPISEDIIEATPPIEIQTIKPMIITGTEVEISQPLSGVSTIPLDFDSLHQPEAVKTDKFVHPRSPSPKRYKEDTMENGESVNVTVECSGSTIREYFDPEYKMVKSYLKCMFEHVGQRPKKVEFLPETSKTEIEKPNQDNFITNKEPVKPILQMKGKGKRTLYNESYLEIPSFNKSDAKKLKTSKSVSKTSKKNVKKKTKVVRKQKGPAKVEKDCGVETAMEKMFLSQEQKEQDREEIKGGKSFEIESPISVEEPRRIITVTAEIHEAPEQLREEQNTSMPKPPRTPNVIKRQKLKITIPQNLDEITYADKTPPINRRRNLIGLDRLKETRNLMLVMPKAIQEVQKTTKPKVALTPEITKINKELQEKYQPDEVSPTQMIEKENTDVNKERRESEITDLHLYRETVNDKTGNIDANQEETVRPEEPTTPLETKKKSINFEPKSRGRKSKIDETKIEQGRIFKLTVSGRKNNRPTNLQSTKINKGMVKSTYNGLDTFMRYCENKRKSKSLPSNLSANRGLDIVVRKNDGFDEPLLSPPTLSRSLNQPIIKEPKIKIRSNITIIKPVKPILMEDFTGEQTQNIFDENAQKIRRLKKALIEYINTEKEQLLMLEKLANDL